MALSLLCSRAALARTRNCTRIVAILAGLALPLPFALSASVERLQIQHHACIYANRASLVHNSTPFA